MPMTWQEQVFDKAWNDPDFFEALVDPSQDTATTCQAAGLSLTSTEVTELESLLASSSISVEVDWQALAAAHKLKKPWLTLTQPWQARPWSL